MNKYTIILGETRRDRMPYETIVADGVISDFGTLIVFNLVEKNGAMHRDILWLFAPGTWLEVIKIEEIEQEDGR